VPREGRDLLTGAYLGPYPPQYMSSNVYVLIFLLLYSIELIIGIMPTGLCEKHNYNFDV